MFTDPHYTPRPWTAEIAARLGLKPSGRGWRGPCPICAYPDAFALDVGRGGRTVGWCSSCQDRAAIAGVLGGDAPTPAQREAATADRAARQARQRERAQALLRGSQPVPGTLADRYLIGRGLPGLAASEALRFRQDCPHPAGSRYPALIAAVTAPGAGCVSCVNSVSAAENVVAVHRTFVDRIGRKARLDPPKASLGPIWGGAIRLDPFDPARPLVIGEGIESSASAGVMLGLPAWAAISAGNLAAGLILPADVKHVVVAVDVDAPGEAAAAEAARRWQAEGRHVQLARPKGTGDFNDILMQRLPAPEACNG